MTALTADRNTPARAGDLYSRKVKASTTIHAGALVALDADGWAVPGATATTLIADGRADEAVVNAGADGAAVVTVRKGVFRYANSAAGDAIAQTDIGAVCYIVDDQTVAKTDGTSSRSVAGTITDVDADGVWVRIS